MIHPFPGLEWKIKKLALEEKGAEKRSNSLYSLYLAVLFLSLSIVSLLS